jgi:hypothetical protein
MTLLAERFDAAIPQPPASMGFLLRGNRATEMIEVMRELDISLLPAKQIPVVASIRSGVYAVNARIHDVFLAEEADPTLSQSRRSELKSAGMVFRQTQDDLKAFGSSLYGRRKKIRPVPIEKNLKDYLQSIPTSPSANSPPSP